MYAMGRGFSIVLGSLVATLSAAAIVLNLVAPQTACRFHLCPETVQLQEARRQMMRGTPDGLAASVRLYEQALSRNPASAYRWCDLAEALLAAGDIKQARHCFSQASRFGPNIPPTLLRVASFHFRQHETRQALRTMARILALVPDYDGLLFNYYDRMGVSVAEILDYGVPPDRRAAQSYFRHLLKTASPADAQQAWQWMGLHGFRDDTIAGGYVDFSLKHRQYEAAAETWAQYAGSRLPGYRRANFVFNGGFEFEPVPCPLDWRFSEVSGASASRDTQVVHSGKSSLRVEFLGEENLSYRQVSQLTCVRPGRMRFSAFVRTAGITTDQGIGFRIFDSESPARLDLRTKRCLGTTDWQRLQLEFVVPPPTRLLAIQVARSSSLKFDSKIAGVAWIDDVVLEPAASR